MISHLEPAQQCGSFQDSYWATGLEFEESSTDLAAKVVMATPSCQLIADCVIGKMHSYDFRLLLKSAQVLINGG